MKILPINIYSAKNIQNSQNRIYNSNPIFTSQNDSFESAPKSMIDVQFETLENKIANNVQPYLEATKDKFIKVAKIGYDSQEKLKIVQKGEQRLFSNVVSALKNDSFENAEKIAQPYKQYQNNIKYFEATAKNMETSSFSTPEIQNYIERNREKMYQNSEEVEKLEPIYDKVEESKQNMLEELDKYKFQNRKVKDLADVNKSATVGLLFSSYQEANDIIKEFNNLKNGYKNKSIPMYQLEKRLEKLHYNVDDFNPTSEKKNEDLDYIDRFLEKNKEYYVTTVSKDYLKSVYEKLNQKSNEAIEKYSNDLDEYIEQNSPNLNQDIIDKTIETQNKINERLNNLIQAEKNKFYEQSYKDFQKNNPDF